MHETQTFAFVQQMHDQFIRKGQGKRHTIWELMEKLGMFMRNRVGTEGSAVWATKSFCVS
jgi:hypothetical protein